MFHDRGGDYRQALLAEAVDVGKLHVPAFNEPEGVFDAIQEACVRSIHLVPKGVRQRDDLEAVHQRRFDDGSEEAHFVVGRHILRLPVPWAMSTMSSA